MNKIHQQVLRFYKWATKSHTETSKQVGTDDMILSRQTVQRAIGAHPSAVYIASIGSDSTGAGTTGNPYRTIERACTHIIAAAVPMDILINSNGDFEPPDRMTN